MKTLLSALSLLLLPLAFTQTLPPNQGVTIKPLWAQQGFDVMNPSAVGHPVITGSSMSGDALLKQFSRHQLLQQARAIDRVRLAHCRSDRLLQFDFAGAMGDGKRQRQHRSRRRSHHRGVGIAQQIGQQQDAG